MTDAKALAQQGVKDAQTSTAVVEHNTAAGDIEDRFRKLLPNLAKASLAKMPPEFIVSTAMTVLRNSEKLRKCDPLSVVHCVVQSAQTGLRLDPVLQQAALVPRWNSSKRRDEAQFMPMYKGLLMLARRSGQIVSVAAQPVYTADEFSIEYGTQQRLVHRPCLDAEKRTKSGIVRYYAYIKLVGGGEQFEVMTQADIDEVKVEALKDKKNVAASPWTTDPIPMALKTVLRRVLKLAPVEDPMLQAALRADEMLDSGVLQEHVVEGGLVVPGGSWQEEEPEAEAKPAPAVAPPAEAKPAEEKKVTDAIWIKSCVAVFAILKKKENREKAVEWAREAKKRFEAGELGEDDFDKIVKEFRKHFPAIPAPQTALFAGDGQATAEAKPQPAVQPAPEPPAAEPAKKSRAKKKAPALADELKQQIDEAEKLSKLFTIKGRIDKADIDGDTKTTLLLMWQAKMDNLKGATQ